MSEYEQYKKWSDNCAQLADVLRELPDDQHNQARWGEQGHSCGTVGCALGWAAMSRRFLDQGLNFALVDVSAPEARNTMAGTMALHRGSQKVLMFNFEGKTETHPGSVLTRKAGEALFGKTVFDKVFMNTRANKQATIDALMKYATVYCDAAKQAKERER